MLVGIGDVLRDFGYLPSVICHKRLADGTWKDHFCLVNPSREFDSAAQAAALAETDLMEAHSAKIRDQSDAAFALSLKQKGYVSVGGFRRAIDPGN